LSAAALSKVATRLALPAAGPNPRDYAALYEAHAQNERDDAIGGGDYVTMGEIELDALREQGLARDSTLVDFGCGTGRLAQHAIPYLSSGRYIGIDISPTFLARADESTRRIRSNSSCDVRWIHQEGLDFDVAVGSVDFLCAFSVFTHMEHEDTLRYLRAIRPLMRTTGRVVLSCLPLSLSEAKQVFVAEAEVDVAQRWSRVRNVVTSVDLMDDVANMAGWRVVTWRPGDQGNIPSSDGSLRRLGQSIQVLAPDA
jgi:cyclopropane fatty-acyl-phospholipid synthase-like methyltransferase